MADNKTKNICYGEFVFDPPDISDQDATRPIPGQIERIIFEPYQGKIKHYDPTRLYD